MGSVRAVGIRELKNRLSSYVASVRRGDVVLVTDRGRVVAELRPPAGHAVATPPGLQRMVERGEVAPGLPHDAASYRKLAACAPPGTARALLDEDRARG